MVSFDANQLLKGSTDRLLPVNQSRYLITYTYLGPDPNQPCRSSLILFVFHINKFAFELHNHTFISYYCNLWSLK